MPSWLTDIFKNLHIANEMKNKHENKINGVNSYSYFMVNNP